MVIKELGRAPVETTASDDHEVFQFAAFWNDYSFFVVGGGGLDEYWAFCGVAVRGECGGWCWRETAIGGSFGQCGDRDEKIFGADPKEFSNHREKERKDFSPERAQRDTEERQKKIFNHEFRG